MKAGSIEGNEQMVDTTKPPMRENPKELSPLERAELRANQILESLGDGIDGAADEFYLDADIVPPGWTYEWKTHTILGKVDPAYQVTLARRGWEPVPTSRHPELMPIGSDEVNIVRKGMILMERPAKITARVRELETAQARDQVRAKEEQLNTAPKGQFERSNKDASMVKVKRAFEPMPVPE